LQNVLKDIPFPKSCFQDGEPLFSVRSCGELRFEASPSEPAVRTVYHEAIQFDIMAESLRIIWDRQKLLSHFHSLLHELQEKLPYDTKSYEEELQKVFEEQQKKINDSFLEGIQAKLETVDSFEALQEVWNDIENKQSTSSFSEEQRFLLKELFEYRRSRLRDLYLVTIYKQISSFKTEEDLIVFWNELKGQLFSFRSYVGKEYELLIAQFIDQRLDEIRSLSLISLGE
jgi:hypothetical protein